MYGSLLSLSGVLEVPFDLATLQTVLMNGVVIFEAGFFLQSRQQTNKWHPLCQQ
jgi:hypothetical protein